jgi:hypothetical protein
MTMALIPPTLGDVGLILWGEAWGDPMAVSLNLSDEEQKACEDDPDNIPAGTEARLLKLCVIPSQEIGMIHDVPHAAGLRRTPAD